MCFCTVICELWSFYTWQPHKKGNKRLLDGILVILSSCRMSSHFLIGFQKITNPKNTVRDTYKCLFSFIVGLLLVIKLLKY